MSLGSSLLRSQARTIHFTNEDANGNGGYIDPTNGKTTYNTVWHIAGELNETTGTWDEFDASTVSGYTPGQAKIEANNDVTVDTPAVSVTITYTKNAAPTPETKNFT